MIAHTLSARDKYTTSNRFVSHFLVIWSVFFLSSNFYIVNILVRTFSLVRSDCCKIRKKYENEHRTLNILSIHPFWISNAVASVAPLYRFQLCNLTYFCQLQRNKVNKWGCHNVMNEWFLILKDGTGDAIDFNKPFFIIKECRTINGSKGITEILNFISKNRYYVTLMYVERFRLWFKWRRLGTGGRTTYLYTVSTFFSFAHHDGITW